MRRRRKEAPDPRSFSLARSLLYSAIITAGTLVLAEFVLWLAGVKPIIQREDPTRGFSGLVSVFVRQGDLYRTRDLPGQRTFNDQSFLISKPHNGYRIFSLGGSSTYGFPWGAEAAYTAVLGDVLKAAHPERTIEAVNAGGTSYGMRRMHILARELVEYEPDLFIIYSGHNEFVEPSFYAPFAARSAASDRLRLILSRWRLYAGLRDLLEPLRPAGGAIDLTVQRDQSRVYGDSEKREIVDRYTQELRDLIRLAGKRGVKVLISTVPANVRDWRPQESVTSSGMSAEERAAWVEDFSDGPVGAGARGIRAGVRSGRLPDSTDGSHQRCHSHRGRVGGGPPARHGCHLRR